MSEPLRILALESYDGGSHAQFLDGIIAHSRHDFTRMSLPARKWKWRMRGAAIYFARQLLGDSEPYDVVFTSDTTAVADLRALLPAPLNGKPIVCYFHENQLTYPLPDESERDYQYGFTNITSCLAADAVWFNSRYHLDSFLNGVDRLLAKMPDFVPEGIADTIRSRAAVLPLGLDPELFDRACSAKEHPPTVLWNHRWEYDKNPDEFFETLFDLQRAGIEFRLIVAGENFRTAPPIFAAAEKLLAERIDHFGYAADRTAYLELLGRGDIIVSTAIHEFFGLAVLEAIAAGCYPLLPDRLSYPELLPPAVHSQCFYNDSRDLRSKLTDLLTRPLPPLPPSLKQAVTDLAWPNLIERFDEAFNDVASS